MSGGGGAGGSGRGGLISTFVRHPTAANMLMALVVIGGLFALMRLNTQFFPDIHIDAISVAVVWPGAGAEDVDATIVQAIEPEVRFLDGVKRVRSTSSEGLGKVVVEYHPNSDMQKAQSEIEAAVSRLTTLPQDSERPVITRVAHYETVARMVLSGDMPLSALKARAEAVRDDLLRRGIDKVDLSGAPEEEIWIEVAPNLLRRLDLSVSDIARQIGNASQDLPTGSTRGGSERTVRALGLADSAEQVGDLVVTLKDGRRVPLEQLARVREAWAQDAVTLSRDGRPAVELHVQRAGSADSLKTANIFDAYIAELRPTLPPSLSLEVHDIAAQLIRDRIDLLVSNGLSGLALVLAMLLIFLNRWVAIWVSNGIFVAIMGTFVVMILTGQSINMISLFAMIMALGIVVDDAIVVAEYAEQRRRAGLSALQAAEEGALRMAMPVFASSLTTIAAFLPLLMISDVMGQIIAAIPMVIIAALLVSLLECYLILPGHLNSTFDTGHMKPSRFRQWFDGRFAAFRDGPFRRLVGRAVRWRYATIAIAIGAVIVSVGMIAGGRVNFVFFQSPEADRLTVNFEMAAGTPRAETAAMVAEIDRALAAVDARLHGDGPPLVMMALGRVGSSYGNAFGADLGDGIGSVAVELLPADHRPVTANAFIAALQEEIRGRAGLSRMSIRAAQGGPPGADIDVRLWGGEVATLKAAAAEVERLLATYPGVFAIEDDLPHGKEDIILRVTDRGRAMGFTTETLGRQLRDSLEGAVAKRFPRGDEEVEVRVMLDRGTVSAAALDDLYLRNADGVEAPLSSIVERQEKTGFARIRRENGVRQVSVTAELDKAVTTNDAVLSALQRDGIAAIAAKHGVQYRFAGKAEEQATTLADMKLGAAIGLSGIYIILCWVFGSYLLPMTVMAIIPLGFVGTVFGHWLMGYNLGMLSMVTLLGLSGIVVNDAIILVETIKDKLAADEHESQFEAVVDGTCDRLRAVILTSVTTIGGLAPLMFETDLQARFLIPLAITICFGLLVSTLLVLFVVPSLVGITHDIRRLFGLSDPRPWEPEEQRKELAAE